MVCKRRASSVSRPFLRHRGVGAGAPPSIGSSIVKDRQIELVKTLGIGDHVDSDDLAVPDREIEDHQTLVPAAPDDAHGAVDERQLGSLVSRHDRPRGHGPRATDRPRFARWHGGAIGVQLHVGNRGLAPPLT